MNADDIGLSFDSQPVKRGVGEAINSIDSLIKKLGQFESWVESMANTTTTELQAPLKYMKQFAGGSVKSLNEALANARASIQANNTESLKLVADQNRALQVLYEARLATAVNLTAKELAEWKSLGVRIGGVQNAQYKEQIAAHKQVADTRAAQAKEFWSGYTKVMVQGSQKSARESAAAFREAFAAEDAKSKQFFQGFATRMTAGNVAPGSARASASVFQEAMGRQDWSAQTQVARATQQATGAYSSLSTGKTIDPAEVKRLSGSFKELANAGNDVHSMARGLASGFNLLWLTWGSLGPLFVGAAISNAFTQTAKTGMEFASTLAIIEHIGGNTAKEMEGLTATITDLAKISPQGPREIAEAVKVLSLAGLKATEIQGVLKTVMNFSVAGTTDMKTAAETLVSVSTAFGLGTEGFGAVSDMVSKAAAESMTSVENFAAAMRTASVVSSQYGVTLKDTAIQLMALSSIGIEASAAGTGLRNAYKDLSGRSVQVAKLLKNMGIEARQANGDMKPLIDIVNQLNERMKGMTGISQKNFLQNLLSERGAKGIIQLLQMVRTEAKVTTDQVKTQFDEAAAKLDDYAGFSALKAAEMQLTTENQFKQVRSILETSMIAAYKQLEPLLFAISQQMQQAFGSPQFISALELTVTTIAKFGKALADNMGLIVNVGTAYAALKMIQLSAVGVQNLLIGGKQIYAQFLVKETSGLVANTAAQTANNVAKSGAVGAATALGRLIPGINIALGIGTALWVAYETITSDTNVTTEQMAELKKTKLVDALNAEADKLKEVNDLRAKGLSQQEAELELQVRREGKPTLDKMAQLLVDKQKADAELASKTKDSGVVETLAASARVMGLQAQIDALKKESDALTEAKKRLSEETTRSHNLVFADAKARKDKAFSQGTEQFSLAGAGGAGSKVYADRYNALQDYMGKTAALYSTQEANIKKANDYEVKILENKYRAGLLSAGEYQARLFLITASGEDKYRTTVSDSLVAVQDAYATSVEERFSLFNENVARIKARGGMDTKSVSDAIKAEREKLSGDLISLDLKQLKLQEDANGKLLESERDTTLKRQKFAWDLSEETVKAYKSGIDKINNLNRGQGAAIAAAEMESQFNWVTQNSSASQKMMKEGAIASAKATSEVNDAMAGLSQQYVKLSEIFADLQGEALIAGTENTPVVRERLHAIAAEMSNITIQKSKIAAYGETYKTNAVAAAEWLSRLKEVNAFSREASAAISGYVLEWVKGNDTLIGSMEKVLEKLRDMITQRLVYNQLEGAINQGVDVLTKYVTQSFVGSPPASAGPAASTFMPDTTIKGSYAGGGFTGSGSRTGGLDGQGGFLSILHPNETVVDHAQGQNIGGGMTQVVINNYTPAQARETQTVDSKGNRRIEVTIGEMVASEIRRPGSLTHSAIRSGFNASPALISR